MTVFHLRNMKWIQRYVKVSECKKGYYVDRDVRNRFAKFDLFGEKINGTKEKRNKLIE